MFFSIYTLLFLSILPLYSNLALAKPLQLSERNILINQQKEIIRQLNVLQGEVRELQKWKKQTIQRQGQIRKSNGPITQGPLKVEDYQGKSAKQMQRPPGQINQSQLNNFSESFNLTEQQRKNIMETMKNIGETIKARDQMLKEIDKEIDR